MSTNLYWRPVTNEGDPLSYALTQRASTIKPRIRQLLDERAAEREAQAAALARAEETRLRRNAERKAAAERSKETRTARAAEKWLQTEWQDLRARLQQTRDQADAERRGRISAAGAARREIEVPARPADTRIGYLRYVGPGNEDLSISTTPPVQPIPLASAIHF